MIFEEIFSSSEDSFVESENSEMSEMSDISNCVSELFEAQENEMMFSSDDNESDDDYFKGWINSNVQIKSTDGMAEYFLTKPAKVSADFSDFSGEDSALKYIEGREKTFHGNWSPSMIHSSLDLARNGFFFESAPDTVTCYFCGLSMRSLQPGLMIREFHYYNSVALNLEICQLAKELMEEQNEKETTSEAFADQWWLPNLEPELTPSEDLLETAMLKAGLLPLSGSVSLVPTAEKGSTDMWTVGRSMDSTTPNFVVGGGGGAAGACGDAIGGGEDGGSWSRDGEEFVDFASLSLSNGTDMLRKFF